MSSCKLVLKMFLCINCSCLKFFSPFVSYFKNIAIASISGNFSSFYKLNRLLKDNTRHRRFVFSLRRKIKTAHLLIIFEYSSSLCIFGKYLLALLRLQTQRSSRCSRPILSTRIRSGIPSNSSEPKLQVGTC